jgi:hypothetical protein
MTTSFWIYRNGKGTDYAALMLDGVPAMSMTRERLFDELARRHVPGIASTMGKQQMLGILAEWQEKHENKPGPPIDHRPGPEAA